MGNELTGAYKQWFVCISFHACVKFICFLLSVSKIIELYLFLFVWSDDVDLHRSARKIAKHFNALRFFATVADVANFVWMKTLALRNHMLPKPAHRIQFFQTIVECVICTERWSLAECCTRCVHSAHMYNKNLSYIYFPSQGHSRRVFWYNITFAGWKSAHRCDNMFSMIFGSCQRSHIAPVHRLFARTLFSRLRSHVYMTILFFYDEKKNVFASVDLNG